VLAEVHPLPEPTLEELASIGGRRPIIVLDQVTDPHNVGAILRSAAVFGAAGLVMTRRHSPPLGGALAKSASGALEHVPVALVQNLARSLAELKELDVILIGLDGDATDRLETLDWPERTALVLGAEGKGLRQLTRDTCDRLCRIATDGRSPASTCRERGSRRAAPGRRSATRRWLTPGRWARLSASPGQPACSVADGRTRSANRRHGTPSRREASRQQLRPA
jgi:tRNA(Leu) C34 or U34 (ribose-2'-O)-methylase TrmL